MPRDHLSLAGPMAIIVVVSVELAALNWGTMIAVDVARFLTAILLAFATYLARYRRGDEAAWWFGFALFGWAYYALFLGGMGLGPAYSRESLVSVVPVMIMDSWMRASFAGPVVQQYNERLRIFHEIFILTVALIGGIVCWAIERRRRPLEARDNPGP